VTSTDGTAAGHEHLRATTWEALAPGFVPLAAVTASMVELALDDPAIHLDAEQATAIVEELRQLRREQLAEGPRGE
jgi:ABC-type cobalamin/Fe3+-siderophores transport system ATPase subunit